MARKWPRKIECSMCREPIDPRIKDRVCASCRTATQQDDEDVPARPTTSNFQKRLAQGFRLLYASNTDGLDE